jgi:hypothetical protein
MKRLTNTPDEILDALDRAGISYKRTGAEVEADIDRTGHKSYKLNINKGLWFNAASDERGRIPWLIRTKLSDYTDEAAPRRPIMPAYNYAAAQQRADEDAARRTAAAQQIWSKAWTCTHEQDMPAGWDRGLSVAQRGAARVKHEEERDAVIRYLSARLGPDHLIHWLRQVRIARDRDGQIMMLAPMRSAGALVGIQRVYLTPDGQKITRKMLGRHGAEALMPPSGVLPQDLGAGSAVTLIGEGWETVAAAVQSAGHAGIVAYDAGGLVQWSASQAALAKSMTPDQIAKARAAVVLVDRDASEAGQRQSARAVKTLRGAGLTAYYAIPPRHEDGGPRGGDKGSDWGDYPREGMSADVLRAHLALAVAQSDIEIAKVPEEKPKTAGVRSLSGFRPAENPAPVAPTLSVEDARHVQHTELMRLVSDYLDWWQTDKEARGPFSPRLFAPSTGVGKSREICSLAQNVDIRMSGARICAGVGNHEQAEPFEQAGWLHFWGRQPDKTRCEAAYCPAHADMMKAVDTHHVPQAEYCHSCSHGLAWSIDQARAELEVVADGDRQRELENRISKHTETLKSRGLDPHAVERCSWQSHLRDAMAAQFVVFHHDSYSDSLVGDALYIADENFGLARTVNVGLPDISVWIQRIRLLLDRAENEKERSTLESALALFALVSDSLAEWTKKGTSGAVKMDASLVERVQDFLNSDQNKRERFALADWERLEFGRDGHLHENPLRALWAIAQSLRAGIGHVDTGNLVVAGTNPIIERLTDGRPVAIFDATPGPAILDIVKAKGGQVVWPLAKQNIRIVRHVKRFWGISALDPKRVGPERVARELDRYKKLREVHPDAAILVHKRAADQLPQEYWDGYWGRDHRAHNQWSGRALVIVGGFYSPQQSWSSEYQADRLAALTAGCSVDAWPELDPADEQVLGAWGCEGSADVQCSMPMPANEHVRDWLLRRSTAETVQAIGRARGANHQGEALVVHVYGGLPLVGLADYGITVDEYVEDDERLGRSRDQVNAERHEAAMVRFDTAAARVVAQGSTITRESMATEFLTMPATGTDGPDNGLWGHGNRIHTTPPQTPFDQKAYTKWLTRIAQIAPELYRFMSETGRGAAVVRAIKTNLAAYGKTVARVAIEITDSLLKQGDVEAWEALDEVEAKAAAAAALPEYRAIARVLAAVLGADDPGG